MMKNQTVTIYHTILTYKSVAQTVTCFEIPDYIRPAIFRHQIHKYNTAKQSHFPDE